MPKTINRNRRQLKLRKAKQAKHALRKKRRAKKISEEKESNFVIDLASIPLLNKKIAWPAVYLAIIFLVLTLIPFNEINSQIIVGPIEANNRISEDNFQNSYPTASENLYREPWQREIRSILAETPMSVMTGAVVKRNRPVAAFLVGIAMKESKFGKYAPKKDGKECYNFWGYRGKENRTASGYSCFDSPDHAVQIVGDRIEAIVKQGARTPADMISWKCGRTCAGHDPESVTKWISDVAQYYYLLYPSSEIARNN